MQRGQYSQVLYYTTLSNCICTGYFKRYGHTAVIRETQVKTGLTLTPVKVIQVPTYMVLCLLEYTLKLFFPNAVFTTYSNPNE